MMKNNCEIEEMENGRNEAGRNSEKAMAARDGRVKAI